MWIIYLLKDFVQIFDTILSRITQTVECLSGEILRKGLRQKKKLLPFIHKKKVVFR